MDLLTQDEIARLTHLSLPTLWRLRKGGQFPRPFRVGGRRLLWKRSEVENWLEREANRLRSDADDQ
jgi:excisionase family DNA binding protein